MSHPVSFKEFGSDNEALYQEYCSVYLYREANLYLRSVTDGDVRSGYGGGDDRSGVAGARGGAAGRGVAWRGNAAQRREAVASGGSGAVKLSLPWRTPALGGGGSGALAGADAGERVVGGAGRGGDGPEVAAAVGGSDGDCVLGRVDGPADRRDEDASAVRDGERLSDRGVGVVSGAVKRGKNYEKNKAKRERAKAQRKAGNVSDRGKTLVSVRAAHPRLDDTWAERKIRENEMAIARMDAQMAKMKREQEDGTAEKRYKVEANLVQGQLDGAFALVPQQRVVSWAKTITSNGSSSTGSSGGKKSRASIPSVSSGLGSGSATTVSAREKKLEQENEKLRKDMEELQAAEIMKRSELRNAVDRKIHFRESEIISLKQKLQSYKAIYG